VISYAPVSDTHQQRFKSLLDRGLADPRDERLWEILSEDRGARLLEVLSQRTRFVTVVLEAVHDGHNQAAVLRSADAFGLQDVTIVEAGARFAPCSGVSQGAHKWLTLHREPDIASAVGHLRQRGYRVFASRLDTGAAPLSELPLDQPVALVFGNEHLGVSDEASELADGAFVVPMSGFVQSMNVSVAAAVAMFETARRARHAVGECYGLSAGERREVLAGWLRLHLPRGRELPPRSAGR